MAFGDSELGDRASSLFTFHDRQTFSTSFSFILCSFASVTDYDVMFLILLSPQQYISLNHSHKRMSLLDERRKSIEWRKNKTKKPRLHVPSKINKKRDEKNEKFLSFVCLPFGGFGFSFHLENTLNDTHLLNMLSSPFRKSRKTMNVRERKTKTEKLLNVHLFE